MRVVIRPSTPYVDRRWVHELKGALAPWAGDQRGQTVLAADAEEVWAEETVRLGHARWTVAYRIGLQYGALVVKEVRLFPTEPEPHRPAGRWSAELRGAAAPCPRGGITTSLVRRSVKPLKAIHAALPHLEHIRTMVRDFFPAAAANERQGLVEELPATPQAGRRRSRISAVELKRVATAYRRAFRRDPHRPIQLAAKALGLPPARVRDLVHLARQPRRGLLPESERGRASIG
jgi:hypothetical protein